MTGLQAVEWLNENLFPDWKPPTGEQLEIWVKRLNGWPEGVLKDAMREHWLAHGKYKEPVLSEILEFCKKFKPKVVIAPGPPLKMRIIDFIRRESDSRHLVGGLTDVRAIECHFMRAWAGVKANCQDDIAVTAGLRLVYGHCRIALLEIGWSEQEAADFARCVVDMKPGDPLPKMRPLFQEMPKPAAQTSFEAIKALAIAEHKETTCQPAT